MQDLVSGTKARDLTHHTLTVTLPALCASIRRFAKHSVELRLDPVAYGLEGEQAERYRRNARLIEDAFITSGINCLLGGTRDFPSGRESNACDDKGYPIAFGKTSKSV